MRVLYTLYTARLSESESIGSDMVLKSLAEMTHDGQPIKANQFLFKAILVNTMLAMHSQQGPTEQSAMMIQGTLSGIFNAQIAYAEGDRNHPFLEEVVSLLCNFFESTGNWRSALYMWHHFLGIQERTFGEVKKEMTMTFKKLATIYSQVGNPSSSATYFEKAQDLMALSLKDA